MTVSSFRANQTVRPPRAVDGAPLLALTRRSCPTPPPPPRARPRPKTFSERACRGRGAVVAYKRSCVSGPYPETSARSEIESLRDFVNRRSVTFQRCSFVRKSLRRYILNGAWCSHENLPVDDEINLMGMPADAWRWPIAMRGSKSMTPFDFEGLADSIAGRTARTVLHRRRLHLVSAHSGRQHCSCPDSHVP
jgi:hypothetical protein